MEYKCERNFNQILIHWRASAGKIPQGGRAQRPRSRNLSIKPTQTTVSLVVLIRDTSLQYNSQSKLLSRAYSGQIPSIPNLSQYQQDRWPKCMNESKHQNITQILISKMLRNHNAKYQSNINQQEDPSWAKRYADIRPKAPWARPSGRATALSQNGYGSDV